MIGKLGEGAFSEVFKAQEINTGDFVAIKCLKKRYTNMEEVNSLPEIRALKLLSSQKNIINLLEIVL